MTEGLAAPGDDRVAAVLAELGVTKDVRLSEEFLGEAFGLLADRPDTLDLKIASAALAEMREAFAMFAPYDDVRKVSIFGSARTTKDDPLYEQTRAVARRLAEAGWMVVTGAGPGIMEAGMEGAGRAKSIGVSIRLPFETGANSVIAGDAKHVSMKYFFTRKLMLVKESSAFVCLPGGFGTLDETFELLTLTQTGKGLPVPIVFLDTPDDRYWEAVDDFVVSHLVQRGLVSEVDRSLYTVTNSVDVATAEIEHFYANYHSIRIVGEELVIRLQRPPTDEQLADINVRFGYLSTDGTIRRVEPFAVERRQNDEVERPRIAFGFDRHGYASIRALIDHLNDL
jgi:uncharacterized protein (TIGR00730 family)